MAEPFVSKTLYAYDKDTDKITIVTLSLGLPEQKREAQWRVIWRIDLNDEAGSERHAAGRDAWQALMLAIPLLKLESKLLFRKKNVSFHFTYEAADQRVREVSLEELFPKDY